MRPLAASGGRSPSQSSPPAIAVNNAGYIEANSIEDLLEDDFRQLEINSCGSLNTFATG
jgi:hypothetical protein